MEEEYQGLGYRENISEDFPKVAKGKSSISQGH
jgi:hypothetical protein